MERAKEVVVRYLVIADCMRCEARSRSSPRGVDLGFSGRGPARDRDLHLAYILAGNRQ